MIRLVFMLFFVATAALAVEPDEVLSDPVLEARARDISTNVRCVVCQNETIDSSNSGVARDLRLLVRERLTAGDTNDEVYSYLVARYGDFVLFKPPWKPTTYALWLAPFVTALLGLWFVIGVFRRSGKKPIPSDITLSPAEETLLADAMSRHTRQDNQ